MIHQTVATAASTSQTPHVSPQGTSARIIVLLATPFALLQTRMNFIHDRVLACLKKKVACVLLNKDLYWKKLCSFEKKECISSNNGFTFDSSKN